MVTENDGTAEEADEDLPEDVVGADWFPA